MPELPEVETIRRDLAEQIVNLPISAVNILSPKTARDSAAFLKASLINRKFTNISRRGKLLIFAISQSSRETLEKEFLLIHLKMTGQLIYLASKIVIAGGHSLATSVGDDLPNRQTRVWLEFKNGGKLFFNDLRRFGYLQIVSASQLKDIEQNNYGPEPLTPEFTLAALVKILKNRRTKIKALLLNQKLIAGLGNIYVDESLYSARLAPERLAGSLQLGEIKKLRLAINQIIRKALLYRGTTFNNYVDSRGRSGNFSPLLRVYGRAGKKCFNCGQMVKKKKLAGRGTHYCPNCQK